MSTAATKRRGRPIAGAISGLLLGVFIALDLAIFAVRPLDNISVFVIPGVCMVLGLLLGLFGPFGGRSAAPAAPAAPPPATTE